MFPPLKRRPAYASVVCPSILVTSKLIGKKIKDEIKDKKLANRSVDVLHYCIFSRINNTEDRRERKSGR
jgi:hypothetical protein